MRHSRKLQIQEHIHHRKTQPLTEGELRGYKLPKCFLHALELARKRSKTDRPLRILDVGCGRGATVVYLLKQGHDVFGGEVDASQVNIAKRGLKSLGFNPDAIVRLDLDSGRYPFPDDYFDIVFSENVIEHVEDLSSFCKEVSRLTVRSGIGAHMFPSRYRINEPHVRLPFVHWLPKSAIRYRILRFAVTIGMDARWVKVRHLSNDRAANVYYEYLERNTFYRRIDNIKKEFEEASLVCDTSLTGKLVVDQLFFGGFNSLPGLSKSLEKLSLEFHTSVLITEKR